MNIHGLKLLAKKGESLMEEGRVKYPVGKWVDVPGNGAYVAVSGGLAAGGVGPMLAWFECDPESEYLGCLHPDGVRCFRRVRRLAKAPDDYAGPYRIVTTGSHECREGDLMIASGSARVAQSGGVCHAFGSSRVMQSGGDCHATGSARIRRIHESSGSSNGTPDMAVRVPSRENRSKRTAARSF